mmetsp:Transcript_12721/g.30163  ORF Transcript_12721/g.30163 Transcript_12721/m.30163 type:complete len:276 (+) Transcript_12721:168-995(+)
MTRAKSSSVKQALSASSKCSSAWFHSEPESSLGRYMARLTQLAKMRRITTSSKSGAEISLMQRNLIRPPKVPRSRLLSTSAMWWSGSTLKIIDSAFRSDPIAREPSVLSDPLLARGRLLRLLENCRPRALWRGASPRPVRRRQASRALCQKDGLSGWPPLAELGAPTIMLTRPNRRMMRSLSARLSCSRNCCCSLCRSFTNAVSPDAADFWTPVTGKKCIVGSPADMLRRTPVLAVECVLAELHVLRCGCAGKCGSNSVLIRGPWSDALCFSPWV